MMLDFPTEPEIKKFQFLNSYHTVLGHSNSIKFYPVTTVDSDLLDNQNLIMTNKLTAYDSSVPQLIKRNILSFENFLKN